MRGNKRGFVITVDSFLGATLVLLFVILSFFYLSGINSNSWNTVDLKLLVSDEASVLENGGVFDSALNQSSSEPIFLALNSTPGSYCFEATIFSPDFTPLVHSTKTGCTKNSSTVASVERVMVVSTDSNQSFFITRTEGWLK